MLVPLSPVDAENEEVAAFFNVVVEEDDIEACDGIPAELNRTGGNSVAMKLLLGVELNSLRVGSAPSRVVGVPTVLFAADVKVVMVLLLTVALEVEEVPFGSLDVDAMLRVDVALLLVGLLDSDVLEIVTTDDSLTGGKSALMVLRWLDMIELEERPADASDATSDDSAPLVAGSANTCEDTTVGETSTPLLLRADSTISDDCIGLRSAGV